MGANQNTIIHFFRNWKRITSLNINKNLQNEIFKSYFYNFVFSKPNPMSKQLRITGFQVSYCDFDSLSIFLKKSLSITFITSPPKKGIHSS